MRVFKSWMNVDGALSVSKLYFPNYYLNAGALWFNVGGESLKELSEQLGALEKGVLGRQGLLTAGV